MLGTIVLFLSIEHAGVTDSSWCGINNKMVYESDMMWDS